MRRHFVLFACLVLAACSSQPPMVECRVGADCASGVCRGDGTCEPEKVVDADAGVTDAGFDAGVDAGMNNPDSGGLPDGGFDAGTPVGCLPNSDGTIERSEVFFQAGLRATYKISGAATFDTAGTAQADGGRAWNFDTMLAGDSSRLVETKALTGEWYEADFPDAGYVSELGQGSDLLGVFSTDTTGLYLQGVVSPADGTTSTRLKYEPWVKVLQFPLSAGDTWETNASVSGRYNGFIVGFNLPVQSERYQMTADRMGDAATPFAPATSFSTLRVRSVMTRSLNFVPSIIIRSYTWNTECFGTVATVTSTNNETSTEFSNAAEVRRLSR